MHIIIKNQMLFRGHGCILLCILTPQATVTGYSEINCMSRINGESRRQPRIGVECDVIVVARNTEKVCVGLCKCFADGAFKILKKVNLSRGRDTKPWVRLAVGD